MFTSLREAVTAGAEHGSTTTFLAEAERCRSWSRLLEGAARRARTLEDAGITAGDRVLLADETRPAAVESLLAINHIGAIPVLVPPPRRKSDKSGIAFLSIVTKQVGARAILWGSRFLDQAGSVRATDLLHLTIPAAAPDVTPLPARPENDVAFLQFSSGSTRTPRGVVVRQESLTHNLDCIAATGSIGHSDVVLSWLPFYHDMGMVAGLLGAPAWRCHSVLMDPMAFAMRPARWLQAISRFGATISLAPNFAFETCLRRVRDDELDDVRLDRWRLAWCGGEPVLADTVRRFHQRFGSQGMRTNVVAPCYGAAECTLEVTSRPPGSPLMTLRLSRQALFEDIAQQALDDEQAVEVTSVGRPIRDTRLRVLDRDGNEVDEGRIGEIEIVGPGVAERYYDGTDRSLADGRFLSGDLGFVRDGELYVTGRRKEVLVVNGRNLYPFDLEAQAAAAGGTDVRRVAVFSVPDPRIGTERVVVAVEPTKRGELDDDIRVAIASAVSAVAAVPAVVVHWQRLPMTTSGKIKRALVRQQYLESLEPTHV